jgi:predicted TIM-barrel fold metal-dependent hydrolase
VADRYERLGHVASSRLARNPIDYIEQNFSFTIITDTFAVDNRRLIGTDRILWSSDYPHMGSDWPHSWRSINHDFSGVPRDERDLILAGNADRLYRFSANTAR